MVRLVRQLVYETIKGLVYLHTHIPPVLSNGLGSERGLFRRFFINNEERNVGMTKACLREREGLL